MARFAVALWRVSPAVLAVNWPEVYDDAVEAPSAFAAIEQVMRAHGLLRMAYVTARAWDGLLVYWAYHLRLVPVEGVQRQEEVYWWMDV